MSNDPKPLGKPYLATDMDYLKQYRVQTWEDAQGGGDETEYSELMKPYLYDEDYPDEYTMWEWTWEDPTWPPIPPVTYPDVGDCDVDENCEFAKIIGPEVMQCGECMTYSQFHLWKGCDIAPAMAAYGEWKLDPEGDCYLLFSGPVMATVCCEALASGVYNLEYIGPLDCHDQISITVECDECCEAPTLSGAGSVVAGNDWVGTIDPACPELECATHVTLVSNSGCTGLTCSINEAGSEITVSGTAGKCGNVTVTIEMCDWSVSDVFNITGGAGDWKYLTTSAIQGLNGCYSCGCGCGVSYHAPCIEQPYKYGTGADPFTGANACRDNWLHQCMGWDQGGTPDCVSGTPPPCSSGYSCSDVNTDCSDHSCPCTRYSYWICHWICSC